MLAKVTRKLSQGEREACDGLLTEQECFSALSGMPHRKTPGSDGFPMEFYLRFWQSFGTDLVHVLNVAYETSQLSTSQRRGLIIILYKKNDHLETKNWRPIRLLNVDYKIATRAISGHLLAVIGTVVGTDQTCGVPGRTISENLSFIRDLIDYVKLHALETRSNGVHYLAVKQSWEKLISDPDRSVEVQVEICPVSVDVLLQQILQHFWLTRSNRYGHGIGAEDTNPSNVDCASASTSINDEDLSEDNDSIRDHAGWAIKRARDVIFNSLSCRLLQHWHSPSCKENGEF